MKSLIKSFGYAFSGIFTCIRNERNMRIHLSVATYMFGFLGFFDWFTVSRTQYALLFIMCAVVMAGELVNTAVEQAVDLACRERNPFAKTAKDCAAGAVLISALFAVCCGIAVLWQPEAFRAMFAYYRTHWYMLLVLALSLAGTFLFIFAMPKSKED